ncbi:creatininase family protein [Candidatus Bathyarchaeota archaeon]|nr:creatininase family protein [Candidatus Bathyarchaeota archaeon]
MSSIFLGELTSEEVGNISSRAEMILVPVGSFEQHGRHLPLATDSIIAYEVTKMVAERISSEFPVLIAPLIPFGKSTEHSSRPGTISVESRIFADLLINICKSLAKHGHKKIVFINGHGGNTDLLSMILRETREQTGSFIATIYIYSEELLKGGLSRFEELEEHDIFHACALETSFMMVLRPDLVNLDKLEKEIPPKFTEETGYRRLRLGKKGVEFSWLIDDVSKSGVIGDPTKASAEIGRTVLQALVDNICDVLREIRKF